MKMQNFEKTLREVTKMDGALTSCLMKWEKGGSTILNSSTNRSLLDQSNRGLKDRSLRERSTHGDSSLMAVGAKSSAGKRFVIFLFWKINNLSILRLIVYTQKFDVYLHEYGWFVCSRELYFYFTV